MPIFVTFWAQNAKCCVLISNPLCWRTLRQNLLFLEEIFGQLTRGFEWDWPKPSANIMHTFAQTLLPSCHALGWMLHTHQRGIKPTQPHYCPIKGNMLLCILSSQNYVESQEIGKHGMMPIKNEWKINHIPKIIITSTKKYYLIPLSPGNKWLK